MRNKHILDKMKVTLITECANNYIQNWLQRVKRLDSQDSKTNVSTTTTSRKTKDKMVVDRNRPLGLILEWKMMMCIYYQHGSRGLKAVPAHGHRTMTLYSKFSASLPGRANRTKSVSEERKLKIFRTLDLCTVTV
jgi:hypothetical protein